MRFANRSVTYLKHTNDVKISGDVSNFVWNIRITKMKYKVTYLHYFWKIISWQKGTKCFIFSSNTSNELIIVKQRGNAGYCFYRGWLGQSDHIFTQIRGRAFKTFRRVLQTHDQPFSFLCKPRKLDQMFRRFGRLVYNKYATDSFFKEIFWKSGLEKGSYIRWNQT